MSEIKPCPFCGEESHMVDPQTMAAKWFVECMNPHCDASGGLKPTRTEAIAAWNQRPEPAGEMEGTRLAPIEVKLFAEADAYDDWGGESDGPGPLVSVTSQARDRIIGYIHHLATHLSAPDGEGEAVGKIIVWQSAEPAEWHCKLRMREEAVDDIPLTALPDGEYPVFLHPQRTQGERGDCRFCGSDDVEPRIEDPEVGFWYECKTCQAGGPTAPTEEEAWRLWKDLASSPSGEPAQGERETELLGRIRTLKDHAGGNVWLWQGDGEDDLESLGCPVLIDPQALLALLATPQSSEMERDRRATEVLDAIRVYASDTLSGRVSPPTDVPWLQDGFKEIIRRIDKMATSTPTDAILQEREER